MDASALAALMAKIQGVMSQADELEELEPFEFATDLRDEVDDGRAIPKPGQILAKQGARSAAKTRVTLAPAGSLPKNADGKREAWAAVPKRYQNANGPDGDEVPAGSQRPTGTVTHSKQVKHAVHTPTVVTVGGKLATVVETSPIEGPRRSGDGASDDEGGKGGQPTLNPLVRLPQPAARRMPKKAPTVPVIDVESLADVIARGKQAEEAKRAEVEAAQRRAQERLKRNKRSPRDSGARERELSTERSDVDADAAVRAAQARLAALAAKKQEEQAARDAEEAARQAAKAKADAENRERVARTAAAAAARIAEKTRLEREDAERKRLAEEQARLERQKEYEEGREEERRRLAALAKQTAARQAARQAKEEQERLQKEQQYAQEVNRIKNEFKQADYLKQGFRDNLASVGSSARKSRASGSRRSDCDSASAFSSGTVPVNPAIPPSSKPIATHIPPSLPLSDNPIVSPICTPVVMESHPPPLDVESRPSAMVSDTKEKLGTGKKPRKHRPAPIPLPEVDYFKQDAMVAAPKVFGYADIHKRDTGVGYAAIHAGGKALDPGASAVSAESLAAAQAFVASVVNTQRSTSREPLPVLQRSAVVRSASSVPQHTAQVADDEFDDVDVPSRRVVGSASAVRAVNKPEGDRRSRKVTRQPIGLFLPAV